MLSVQAGLQSFDGVHFRKEEEEAEEEEEEEEEQERLGGISERKSILVVSKITAQNATPVCVQLHAQSTILFLKMEIYK